MKDALGIDSLQFTAAVEAHFSASISDQIIISTENGKPKNWDDELLRYRPSPKEKDQEESIQETQLGILDLLGNYSPLEIKIRLYPEAICELAALAGWDATLLTQKVLIHEIGHAMVHIGTSTEFRDKNDAKILIKRNRFFASTNETAHEFLAQSFTWITINESSFLKSRKVELLKIFSDLSITQPRMYQIWGHSSLPNTEAEWKIDLKTELNHQSHPDPTTYWSQFIEKIYSSEKITRNQPGYIYQLFFKSKFENRTQNSVFHEFYKRL